MADRYLEYLQQQPSTNTTPTALYREQITRFIRSIIKHFGIKEVSRLLPFVLDTIHNNSQQEPSPSLSASEMTALVLPKEQATNPGRRTSTGEPVSETTTGQAAKGTTGGTAEETMGGTVGGTTEAAAEATATEEQPPSSLPQAKRSINQEGVAVVVGAGTDSDERGNANEMEDDDKHDDTSDVAILPADPNRRKKQRGTPWRIRTVAELYAELDQDPEATEFGGQSMRIIAENLVQHLRKEEGLSQEELDKNGVGLYKLLVEQVFGTTSAKRLANTYKEFKQTKGKPDMPKNLLTARTEKLPQYAQRFKDDGHVDLSDFTMRCFTVIQHDNQAKSLQYKVRITYEKLMLVKALQTFETMSAEDSMKISNYLDQLDSSTTPSRTKKSRIITFFAKELGITNKTFTNYIYRWTPITILSDIFGLGILPLLPPNIETWVRHLSATGTKTKRKSLQCAAEYLRDNHGCLRELCDQVKARVVDPMRLDNTADPLQSGNVDITFRRSLLPDGDELSLWSLFGAGSLGNSGDGAGGDGGGKAGAAVNNHTRGTQGRVQELDYSSSEDNS